MDKHTKELISKELVWLPEQGIGYYPVGECPYDQDYFNKYQSYADSDIGVKLNRARTSLVKSHTSDHIVDIGIGCGTFIDYFGNNVSGFDINPAGVKWLEERGLYCDIYNAPIDSVCFWDSLEHIKDPTQIFENIKQYAFVSTPIYNDVSHVLSSRHFRKDEHCWYWTHDGFIKWMKSFGFRCVEVNSMEIDAGREDIMTFVFIKESYKK